MIIRETTKYDLAAIVEIVCQAQEYFRSRGIDQWQNDYPTESVFLTDMELGESFVLEEDGRVIGTFMASFREDPAYRVIVDGDWQYKEPYAVIHRVAMDNRVKGRGYGSQIIQGKDLFMCCGEIPIGTTYLCSGCLRRTAIVVREPSIWRMEVNGGRLRKNCAEGESVDEYQTCRIVRYGRNQ